METSFSRFSVFGDTNMEVNKASESNGDEKGFEEETTDLQELTTKLEKSTSEYESSVLSSSTKKEMFDEQLESVKAEIDEVMEENQRLRTYLDGIMKDYRTLQTQYQDHFHQQAKTSTRAMNNHHSHIEEPEFVALSLGRTSSGTIKNNIFKIPINQEMEKESLKLQLDCKVEALKTPQVVLSPDRSTKNSIEEVKEDIKETSSPTEKGIKNDRDGEEDLSLHNPAKRARVSVRVRCDTPSMNDGCQWRKYGQKIAKGNPCPRAYYRCTVAQSCPVRKQVQRCAQDMSILITTYEGTHNHPLPVSATAMASTTSAAVSMLLSGSSTSESVSSSLTTTANINGLNFYLSDNSRPKSAYLSNSLISSNPSFPTITLDLTSSSSSSLSHLNRQSSYPPRYPTTNPSFNSLESNSLPISWSSGILTNYASQQSLNKNQSTTNSLTTGAPQESLYQSLLNKIDQQQKFSPGSIAAVTKAITTDQNFQSALAAALTSLIFSAGGTESKRTTKPSEPFPILSSFSISENNSNKCAATFGNNSSSSTSTHPGSLMFLSSSFPFTNSKSKSTSLGDHVP